MSCYQLTISEGTTFGRWKARGKLVEMSEPEQATLFELTHERLGAAGWSAYEVSNFARGPRHRSEHNQKYWEQQPYLGLGPSAHSFDGTSRWWNIPALPGYVEAIDRGVRPVADRETLTRSELALEAVMLRLRTRNGLSTQWFMSSFGIDIVGLNGAYLGAAVEEGLIEPDALARERTIRPTVRGFAVADGIAAGLRLE